MAVKIGSARIDENGKTHGGKAGDQTGKEVSTQSYYVHTRGWRVLRCKDAEKAEKIAHAMQAACDNANIGYDQYQRDTLYNLAKTVDFDPAKIKTPCETDCSALVRVCCAYAGIMVGNMRTTNEAKILLASGEFDELKGAKYTDQSAYLRRGDILVTRTQGHTVVVLTNGAKAESPAPDEETEVHETLKRGMKGEDVRRLQQRLMELGYSLPKYGADGDYGSETATAVKAFQADRNLTVDGVAGEATLTALYAGQGNTYTVTLHGVPEADAIALIGKYDGEIEGALG
ncbi:MAG: peptidoglycan-binding domain-containing protein [Clostridia bacterium]|nr:peptidoglycan-binding domain-containing protein [Clostridia bacterium]